MNKPNKPNNLDTSTELTNMTSMTSYYHGSGSIVLPSFDSKTWRSSEFSSAAFLRQITLVNSELAELALSSLVTASAASESLSSNFAFSISNNEHFDVQPSLSKALECYLILSFYFLGTIKKHPEPYFEQDTFPESYLKTNNF